MTPTLADGEFVLIDPARRPQVGEVVVCRHPDLGVSQGSSDMLVVKRLAEVLDDGQLVLASDNPDAGTDSRTWGPVDPSLMVGTVTVVLDRLLSADLGALSR